MSTKDRQVVQDAKKYAEYQLSFYREMMSIAKQHSITVVKPDQAPPSILKDSAEGIHVEGVLVYKKYLNQKVHDDMLNLYRVFSPDHRCELCKLKT